MTHKLNQAMACLLLLALAGCPSRPSRVSAPSWDPEPMAAAAIEQADANGDGFITKEEAQEAAPGLHYCLPELDTDNDGQLSEAEIAARIKLYRDMRIGMTDFICRVVMDGRPLPGAQVRFVPEPFIGEVVKPSVGATLGNGIAQMAVEGEDFPAAGIGIYRVEITHSGGNIPARYNTETELGVEISGVTNSQLPSQPVFELSSK